MMNELSLNQENLVNPLPQAAAIYFSIYIAINLLRMYTI